MTKQEIIPIIDRVYSFKIFGSAKLNTYTQKEFESELSKLKAFDINLLWDKRFWRLGQNESICAVASEPYSRLRVILENF